MSITSKNSFDIVMKKREANARAFDDYEKALTKYCTPRWIYGLVHGRHQQVFSQDNIIVRVMDTEVDMILFWKERILTPFWRVEIMSDPTDLTRYMKGLYIEGPNYELGHKGSTGPMQIMTPHYHQARNRTEPPRKRQQEQHQAPLRG